MQELITLFSIYTPFSTFLRFGPNYEPLWYLNTDYNGGGLNLFELRKARD